MLGWARHPLPDTGGIVNKERLPARSEVGVPPTTGALVQAGWRPVLLGADLWTDGQRRAQVWRSGPREFVVDVTSAPIADTTTAETL
jgi:hypothetical protein